MDCKRVLIIASSDCCGGSPPSDVVTEPAAKRQKLEPAECVTIEPEDFECAICYDVLLEPVVGRCGHDYCKHCIEEWRKKQGSCLSCPICRETLLTSSRDSLGVCRRLREMVEKLFPERLALRRVRVAALLAARAAKAAQAEAEAAAAAASSLPPPSLPLAVLRAGSSGHSVPTLPSEVRQERGRVPTQSSDRSRGRSRGSSSSSSSRSRSRSRGRSSRSRRSSRDRRSDRHDARNGSYSRRPSPRRHARPMSHQYSNQYHFTSYGGYSVHYQTTMHAARPLYPAPPPFRHHL